MTEQALTSPRPAAGILRRLGVLLPVADFGVVAVGLGIGLTRNSQELPLALIGKPVPEFALPPVQGRTLGLSSADLAGEVSLVSDEIVKFLRGFIAERAGAASQPEIPGETRLALRPEQRAAESQRHLALAFQSLEGTM